MLGFKLLGRSEWKRAQCYVFEGKPLWYPGKELAASLRLWIRTKDGLLAGVGMYDFDGKEVLELVCRDLKINVEIPDELFTYTPPEGVEVADYAELLFGKRTGD